MANPREIAMEYSWPRVRLVRDVLVALVLVQFLLIRDAQAYIDPGTVSFFFQAIIAALFGTLLVAKRYWRQLAARVRSRREPKKQDDQA